MVVNFIDVSWHNAVLSIIYKIEPEAAALKKRLLECIMIVDYGDNHSARYIDALKELEAFGAKHLL
jgi:hypothetical protein